MSSPSSPQRRIILESDENFSGLERRVRAGEVTPGELGKYYQGLLRVGRITRSELVLAAALGNTIVQGVFNIVPEGGASLNGSNSAYFRAAEGVVEDYPDRINSLLLALAAIIRDRFPYNSTTLLVMTDMANSSQGLPSHLIRWANHLMGEYIDIAGDIVPRVLNAYRECLLPPELQSP